MTVQEDEINLMDLWNVVTKRKNLIVALALGSSILALAVSLLLPKVYEGEAVVSLPPKVGITSADSLQYQLGVDLSKVMITVAETKAISDTLIKKIKKKIPIDSIDGDLLKIIDDVKIDQIKGSEGQFKIIARVKKEPQRTKDVINKILDYLNKNEYVQKRISIEKSVIEANIAETKRTIEKAQGIRNEAVRLISVRNPVGFNPVDLDVRIRELKSAIISLETNLALLKGYEFVSGPHAYENKVSPKVSLNTIIAGMVGLFIGLLLAFLSESIEKQRKAGVN